MADDIKTPAEHDKDIPPGVVSVTDTVPHPADASSAPGPYDMPIERPPVSTTKPDVPIAQSLVAGAGEGDQNTLDPESEQAAIRGGGEAEPGNGRRKKAEE